MIHIFYLPSFSHFDGGPKSPETKVPDSFDSGPLSIRLRLSAAATSGESVLRPSHMAVSGGKHASGTVLVFVVDSSVPNGEGAGDFIASWALKMRSI